MGSSSPARDRTQVPAIEIMKSWLLHHQWSPSSSTSKHHILTQKSKAEEGPSPLYDPFWDQGDHCQIPPADFPLYLIVWVCIICLLLITNKGSIITITGLLIKISLPQESLACVLSHFSHVWLFVTRWTVARQPLCPWNFPGMSTGVGCHALLQGILPTQGSNGCLLCLLYCRGCSYH